MKILLILAILGSGLNAGLFFIFSNTVMEALRQIGTSKGMSAMQSINRVILNPIFFSVFFGTALLAIVLAVLCWQGNSDAVRWFTLKASLLYLLGCIGVTITRNVPLNEMLDKENSDSAEGERLWERYLTEWTRWNHVRTVACMGALVYYTLSLLNL